MKQVGDEDAQKKEGIIICAEIVNKIKDIKGLSGIHIISGGKENMVPDVIKVAGL
jgi:methylenetetrahydrofolate reductase (NADPH)